MTLRLIVHWERSRLTAALPVLLTVKVAVVSSDEIPNAERRGQCSNHARPDGCVKILTPERNPIDADDVGEVYVLPDFEGIIVSIAFPVRFAAYDSDIRQVVVTLQDQPVASETTDHRQVRRMPGYLIIAGTAVDLAASIVEDVIHAAVANLLDRLR